MTSPDETPVRVEAYAGGRYPERPLRVEWRGQMREVIEVEHQWQEPDRRFFVVTLKGPALSLPALSEAEGSKGDIRLRLCYDFRNDAWTCLPAGRPPGN